MMFLIVNKLYKSCFLLTKNLGVKKLFFCRALMFQMQGPEEF
jgi:hypothetical protein